MDRTTAATYEAQGGWWAAHREPVRRAEAEAFAARVPHGTLRIDVGAGAGRYTNDIGAPVVALDVAATMLDMLRGAAPDAMPLRADLERLPFRRGAFGAAWSNMSYQHIARDAVPLALADLHRSLSVGAPIEIQVSLGKEEAHRDDEHIGRRFFGDWQPESFGDVLVGAGFDVDTVEAREEHHAVLAKGCRARTLPDTVGTNMRVLVCGLNPSIYSADRGIGFARPGNRFWRAALDARMVTRDRDTRHALDHHRIGMTDLCKRATATSRELTREEYSAGAARVERLVAWLQPRIVLFVGLEGWRAAIDRNAQPGLQPHSFGGAPAYVMPSTSGLNARTSIADHTAHLRRVLELSQPKLRL